MSACKTDEEDLLIGKWQNDRDWFVFKQDKTYSSGKDDIQMVDQYKYTMDPSRHELNLYTDDSKSTYYLIYEFRTKDTLLVRNALSSNKTMIPFVRIQLNKE
jgi:hypothetical protein